MPLGKPTGRFALLEAYVTNHRKQPVEFVKAFLDGEELKTFPNDKIVWWQFYPSAIAKPGETILLQICFDRNPQTKQSLQVETKDGDRLTFDAPPFILPAWQIVGLTFGKDMQKAFIAFLPSQQPKTVERSRLTPSTLRLNGKDITRSVRMMEHPVENRPGVFAIELKAPLSIGQPLHCRLDFPDGNVAQCLLRASNGISLDSYGVDEKDEKLRRELGLDIRPPVLHLSEDVACYDQPQRPGYNAPSLLETRRKAFETGDTRLASVFLCVMARPQISYPVYGQCADVLQANPYRLQYSGRDIEPRFIEKEENFFCWAWLASRPRPWHYAPEVAFFPKRKLDRIIEPQELRLLTYAALGNGAKGIHYFAHGNIEGEYHGFQENPALLAKIKQLNAEIKMIEPILAPAFPMSIETVGGADNGVCLYRLVCGDSVVLIVRSLAYTTSREPNRGEQGQTRFKWLAPPDQPVEVAIEKPSWFKFDSITDPLRPEGEISWRVEGGKIVLAIPLRGGGRSRVAEESRSEHRLIERQAAHEKRNRIVSAGRDWVGDVVCCGRVRCRLHHAIERTLLRWTERRVVRRRWPRRAARSLWVRWHLGCAIEQLCVGR